MCRWGCSEVTTTFMCKWCGTRYCKACLRGEFPGLMREPTTCAQCKQNKCQGQRVETVLKEYLKQEEASGKKTSRSAVGTRSVSARRGNDAAPKDKSIHGKKSKSGSSKSNSNGKKK
ncbi:unnamed protein product [Candidula unifasciata]|uniref:Uncharacterized protein n=1 Tax=Candidula unifasciata TaxID=100452 RepID=A0A8S3YSK0_9EUPU|nr:unnamed protein product [Candidula unifasciata]